ncbi:MAG: hypothetical protein ACTSVW_03185 [Candidatus Njordarchaeales archaeon]
MENFFTTKYQIILSHRDWDGLFGGALISRIFELPVKFHNRIDAAEAAIIVEVPISRSSVIESSLIIDHHNCKKSEFYALRYGNMFICDEKYPSVTQLISDIFNEDLPSEFQEAINYLEQGEINKSQLANDMFFAYISNLEKFPFNMLLKAIRDGNWKFLHSWIIEKTNKLDKKRILTVKDALLKDVKLISRDVALIKYRKDNPLENGASKLALLELQDEYKVVIALALKNGYVEIGTIATKKNINLNPVFTYLENIGIDAGGRRTVGGFRFRHNISLEQVISILKEAMKELI